MGIANRGFQIAFFVFENAFDLFLQPCLLSAHFSSHRKEWAPQDTAEFGLNLLLKLVGEFAVPLQAFQRWYGRRKNCIQPWAASFPIFGERLFGQLCLGIK